MFNKPWDMFHEHIWSDGVYPQEDIWNLFKLNSYGKEKLDPFKKKEICDSIANEFCDFFVSRWYALEKPVSINSWIDESVLFIGAPTSVLKPYLVSWTIPNKWICMQQPSFRTHNAKRLKDENPIKWWSTFTGFSTMSNYADRENLLKDTIDFFLDILKIPLSNIAINISSRDVDLLHLLDVVWNKIPLFVDTKPLQYYNHKYWLEDIIWRNFNIVLKDEKTWSFNDVGNYIVIENSEKKYGIESWYGNSSIMKEIYWLDHILDTSLLSNFIQWNSVNHRKLQDSIIVSFVMCHMGIIPRRHDTKWRIFKRYLSWIKYNQEKLNINFQELENILKSFEQQEYWYVKYADIILDYLE